MRIWRSILNGNKSRIITYLIRIEIKWVSKNRLFFSNALQNVLDFLLSSGNRGSETAAMHNGGLGVPDRRGQGETKFSSGE